MSLNSSVSIIISTRNRSEGLRRTLRSLADCDVLLGWDVEAIIVDNASSDPTEEVVRSVHSPRINYKYAYESKIGLSHARNAGLSCSEGDIILFTDDDVLVDKSWIIELATPIRNARCEAAVGLVSIAPGLIRPWMTPTHRGWLASSIDAQIPNEPTSLVGANMGISRSVLSKVPEFDTELGSGALGAGEDTLFGWQLIEAGYRIEFNEKARVAHEFDASRLLRRNWIQHAVKRGRTEGYLLHHWEHGRIDFPKRQFLSFWTRLKLRRMLQPPGAYDAESCPTWEMSYVANMARCLHFRIESRRERLYAYRGLKKRVRENVAFKDNSMQSIDANI
jgi:glucosyl-dolichyl phosphate glucuronosyltransferase